MSNQLQNFTLAHELDAAWIIALWMAIHGGDPSPIEVDARSTELVGALASHLERTIGRSAQPLTSSAFEARLAEMGIQLQRPAASGTAPGTPVRELAVASGNPEGPPREPPQYCFVFRGTSYCVQFLRRPFAQA